MAEPLRGPAAVLSPDSSNFSRNMRTVNRQTKEAGSTFRLAGAGVENDEKAIPPQRHHGQGALLP